MVDRDAAAALARLRERVDALDRELLRLFNDRARIAIETARLKQQQQMDLHSAEREQDVLRRVMEENSGPLEPQQVTRLFRELMSSCLALQQQQCREQPSAAPVGQQGRPVSAAAPTGIACLGPAGTFSHVAVLEYFGAAARPRFHGVIQQVFQDVEAGTAALGVVPVENSIEGGVNDTLSVLQQDHRFGLALRGSPGDLALLPAATPRICGELDLEIHHHLLSQAADLPQIRVVTGHIQSLAQCRHWLDRNLPRAQRMFCASSAEAAQRAAGDAETAAIAGAAAARYYRLPRLATNIEDQPDNNTRFLLLGRQTASPSGKDKTSLLLGIANQVGALYRILECFAAAQVNLSFIQSRPVPGHRRPGREYEFFVDALGHVREESMQAALNHLQEHGANVRWLGSYAQSARS